MEVVGHHVEEIDVFLQSLEVEVGDLVGSARGGHRNFIVTPALRAELVELLAYQAEKGRVIISILGAFTIATQSATARVFPVEIDTVEHRVGIEEVINRVRKRLPSGGRRKHTAEIA